MIEIFITNITEEQKAIELVQLLKKEFVHLEIDYDMNETSLPFPCGHTVLRVEGLYTNTEQIIALAKNKNIICEIMKDKICD